MFGSGRITLPGNSQIGDQDNQTIRTEEMKTAWNTAFNLIGMMPNALTTNRLSAARIFGNDLTNLTNCDIVKFQFYNLDNINKHKKIMMGPVGKCSVM